MTFDLDRQRPDWRLGERSEDRLQTVTLHYHEWLYVLAEAGEDALFRHYLSDWIEHCALDRPGARALAWNAYAIATRLGWWIRSHRTAPDLFDDTVLRSLWEQAAYLADHVEWDLRGNHLMRDAVGLAWAGRFFDGDEPRAWLRQATDLATSQIEEQVLADGGHFERSPKYHVDVMRDVLTLASLVEDDGAVTAMRGTWDRMAEYLAWMRHPDGDVPLFNDGSLLGAGTVEARRGGRHFAETGVVAWHGDPWTLFFDVGPIGPDHQPGHGHADTLTIEASFADRRLFVDPGTYAYDDDERRRYDRGTGSHNTVCVDGHDSSETWRIFRVGRRARPLDVDVRIRADGVRASATHDGYDHLPGGPRHRREARVEETGNLVLVDCVEGAGAHRAEGGLLVEPSWTVETVGLGWRLAGGNRRLTVIVDSSSALDLFAEKRPYHPRYGVELEATRIGWRWQGSLPVEVRITTSPAG